MNSLNGTQIQPSTMLALGFVIVITSIIAASPSGTHEGNIDTQLFLILVLQ
jgi:hypothetical protein